MSLNALGLGITLFVEDAATSAMDKVRAAFLRVDSASTDLVKRFDRNVQQFKLGLGIMGAGVATLGTAFALAGPAGKFEQSMADVQSISGATAAELKQLKDAALQAGIATQFSPLEASHALRELAAQGYSARESIQLLQPALDLAAASLGELGVAEAAQLSAQTLKAFSIEVGGAKMAVDQLLQSANLFALAPKDLPLAVGIGARGAQLMHQSLSETLIALGLTKNVIPTVERASTAVAVAMERLAAPTKREMKYIDELGIHAADSKGRFRPFLDVLQEVAQKLGKFSEKDQALLLNRIFGAEGGAGAQAILTQLNNGIKTTTGEVLMGAEAIAYLRKQMADAAGTAKQFADRRLDTFEGQKTLLHGSMETLAIVVGDAFAKALKPMVAGTVALVNRIIQIVQAVPDSFKAGFAKAVLVLGGLLTAFGTLLALKGAIVAIGLVVSVLGGAIASAALAMAPLLAAFAAGILMFEAFKINAEAAGGGVLGVLGKITLLFKALAQVFSSGEFSGAVLDELNKAGNGGIKDFAIKAFVWFTRVKNFFSNLADGFRERIQVLEPTFERLRDAIGLVASAFGLAVGPAKDNQSAFDAAGSSGRSLGDSLAQLAGIISNVLTVGLLVAHTGLQIFKTAWRNLGPISMAAAKEVWGAIQLIIGVLGGDWDMAWRGAFGVAYGYIEALIKLVVKLGDLLDHMGFSYLKAAVSALGLDNDQAVAKMLGDLKAEGLNMVGINAPLPANPSGQGTVRFEGYEVPDTLAAPGLQPVSPFETFTAGGRNARGEVQPYQLPATLASAEFLKAYGALNGGGEAAPAAAQPPGLAEAVTNVNLFLDSDKVAQAQVRKKRDEAARAFQTPAAEY